MEGERAGVDQGEGELKERERGRSVAAETGSSVVMGFGRYATC